jgi:hypothetical protein
VAGCEFDPEGWVNRLAYCIELELLTWHVRMSLDKLRGPALDCAPWHQDALMISFLTDRERFDEAAEGKWETPSWRFFNFTAGPNTSWPFATEVMRAAHEFYSRGGPEDERQERRDELCRCCARALRHVSVQKNLCERYNLTDDFGLYTGHPDDPARNFCDEV